MFRQIILVGLGGGLGSIARYLVSVLTLRYNYDLFPVATFIVNVTGSFLIGVLVGFLSQTISLHQDVRLLLVTGFCGGYTTFSTFSSESLGLLQSQHYFTAALYIAGSVLLGLAAVWLGFSLTK